MSLDGLTERQRMLAMMVRAGYSNTEIAIRLDVSEGNVRNRLTVIYNILGIDSGCQRARLAAMVAEERQRKQVCT